MREVEIGRLERRSLGAWGCMEKKWWEWKLGRRKEGSIYSRRDSGELNIAKRVMVECGKTTCWGMV